MLKTFEHSLNRVARSHLAQPLLHMREIILVVLILAEHATNSPLPRDEDDIRIGQLVAHEPRPVTAAAMLPFLPRQIPIQDAPKPD